MENENIENVRVRYILSNIEQAHIKIDLLKIAMQVNDGQTKTAERIVEISKQLESYIWTKGLLNFKTLSLESLWYSSLSRISSKTHFLIG